MRIGVDLTALLEEPTGVDVSLRRLVVALGALDRESRYTIFVNHEDRRAFDGTLPENFRVLPLAFRPRAARLLFQQAIRHRSSCRCCEAAGAISSRCTT
jgi:hypothetical protein